MAKPIELDLRRGLPKVREQYEHLIDHIGACRYSAPCAIGAMLPPEVRQRLAKSLNDETAIEYLGRVIRFPKDQRQDAIRLQSAFDSRNIARFNIVLAELEAKYLPASGIEGEAGDPKGLHPEGESPAPQGGETPQ